MSTIIEKIIKEYGLELVWEIEPLTGGVLHKMYKIESKQGSYALKLLNPFIMQRKDAIINYERAKKIEKLYASKE